MNLRALVETAPDAEFLRRMITPSAERRLERVVGAATGRAQGATQDRVLALAASATLIGNAAFCARPGQMMATRQIHRFGLSGARATPVTLTRLSGIRVMSGGWCWSGGADARRRQPRPGPRAGASRLPAGLSVPAENAAPGAAPGRDFRAGQGDEWP
jgi:hypothetical protein